jgi:hypothetical protein
MANQVCVSKPHGDMVYHDYATPADAATAFGQVVTTMRALYPRVEVSNDTPLFKSAHCYEVTGHGDHATTVGVVMVSY